MTRLLSTKTQVPRTFGSLIERPRLLNILDHVIDVPVTLLDAPAGFGKTTLLCQWVQHRRNRKIPTVRAAWLSLDEQDTSVKTFLSYFVAALRTVYPNACAETELALAPLAISSDQALVISLVNELSDLGNGEAQAPREHVVLILDDYHLVNTEAINTVTTAMLRQPPSRFHLVIACRFDPALPLARWRTENRLLEIRSADLRLNRSETEQFLRQAVPIEWTPAQLASLDEKTEGWAAGLQLFAMSARDGAGAERMTKAMDVPHQNVMHYLMEDVVARLPQETQAQLMQLSILDRFNAEVCQAVCDGMRESGAEFIAELERMNLFLIGLDDTGTWYRFHHLLRELLQRQLKQRFRAAERAALHRRAMDWYIKNDSPDDALAHALAAGDTAGAAELVAAYRHTLMNREEWQRLAQWLAMFSSETVAKFPDLLLAKAWHASVVNFDQSVTRILALQAANLLDSLSASPARSAALRAEVDVFQAMQIYRSEANGKRVVKLTAHALDVLPLEWSMVRMHAYIFMAGALQLQGDLGKSIETLRRAQTEEVLSEHAARTRAFRSEAMIHWMAGNLPAMLESATKPNPPDARVGYRETELWARYFIAAASYERNDLATAEAQASAALNDPNPWAAFRPAVDCALILALVYEARNMHELAREVLQDVLGWALEKHSETLTGTIRAFQANLALRQGDMVTANRWHDGFGNPTPTVAMPNFSSPFITAVKVLLAQNTPESRRQAGESLARLEAHLRATHNVRFLIDVLALQALLRDLEGDRERALTALRRALVLAEPGGFVRLFVDLGEPMASLLTALGKADGSSPYLKALLGAFRKPMPQVASPDLIEPLSERELAVLELLAKRLSNKEIAQELAISPLTVKAHTAHIYQKLGVNSRQAAVNEATKLGLLPAAA